MRHVRDVMRMKSAGMPTREIARRVGAAPSTVRLTIRRFEAAGLSWPLPADVTDAELEARLYAGVGAGPGTRRGQRRQAEPDWASVHRELRRKHVTLSILWEEYIAGEQAAIPLGRLAHPEEIASTVAFLASDEAAFITGQSIAVNGGALVVGA